MVNGPAKIDIRDVIGRTVQVVYHNNMNRNANIKVKMVQKGSKTHIITSKMAKNALKYLKVDIYIVLNSQICSKKPNK